MRRNWLTCPNRGPARSWGHLWTFCGLCKEKCLLSFTILSFRKTSHNHKSIFKISDPGFILFSKAHQICGTSAPFLMLSSLKQLFFVRFARGVLFLLWKSEIHRFQFRTTNTPEHFWTSLYYNLVSFWYIFSKNIHHWRWFQIFPIFPYLNFFFLNLSILFHM